MAPLRFGVLGLGFMGKTHAMNLLKHSAARLTAVADPHPDPWKEFEKEVKKQEDKSLADQLDQVQHFEDADALIAADLCDALILCLPTFLHESTAALAFEKGLHVLCEKPIALDLDSASRMIEAGAKAERKFMVAHCIRFWPEYLFLRELVASGDMGRLLSLNMHRISGMPAWAWEGWLLDHDKSGGPLVDLHIHDVDFALFLLGEPDSLIATGRASSRDSGLDMVHTLYRYDQGPQVHLHAGWSTAPIPFRAGYEAWFEKGFVRYVCSEESLLEVYEKGNEEPVPAKVPTTDAYAEELSYFIGTLLTDSAPDLCTPESSRKALALSLAGLDAARTGSMVSGDEILKTL